MRYAPTAGDIGLLVAPPYDVLSHEERERYAASNDYNAVHVTLPVPQEGDRSKYVRYMRSASALESWKRNAAIGVDGAPAFYRYQQRFTIPNEPQRYERLSIIGLLKLEPYERGIVLPHEFTYPRHKEDRLRLLEATRTHVECIYGLYDDDGVPIHDAIAHAPGRPVAHFSTPDGIEHELEIVDQAGATCAISGAFEPKKVWIADGHHRYETALAFRGALGPREGIVAEDFMMMALSSMRDPGLVLLPTHRYLTSGSPTATEVREAIRAALPTEEAPNTGLPGLLAEAAKAGRRALGVALPGGRGLLARFDDPTELATRYDGHGSSRLRALDVSLLHGYVFAKLLGLSGTDFYSYTRDDDEAIAAVESGSNAAFLMNPPTIEDMRVIAMGGEKMPQKSTYYYPKLLSGLVYWSLNDFDE